jgi:hypothetical protein
MFFLSNRKLLFNLIVGALFFVVTFTPLKLLAQNTTIGCRCNGEVKTGSAKLGWTGVARTVTNQCVEKQRGGGTIASQSDCDEVARTYFVEDTITQFSFVKCAADPSCGPAGTVKTSDFKIRKPILNILIPDLTFSDINTTTDDKGNIQVSWIGEYIVAIYRLLVNVASVLGVILIIREGIGIILSAGGGEKMEAYQHIGRILIGLILAWFSYIILFNLNSSFVAIRPLNIRSVVDNVSEISDEDPVGVDHGEAEDIYSTTKKTNPKASGLSYSKCPWENHSKFDCDGWRSGTVKPCGGVPDDPAIIDSFDKCGDIQLLNTLGQRTTVKVLKEVSGPVCTAVKIAKSYGYELRFTSSLRDFNAQAKLWCDQYKANGGRTPSGVGTPGYSNHMYGRAVDVYLFRDGKRLTWTGLESVYEGKTQCDSEVDAVRKIAEIFYASDPKDSNLKFYRLSTEVWHFELKSSPGNSKYGRFFGFPSKCAGKPQN